MGLDMFLEKKTYIGAHYEFRNVDAKIEITSNGKLFNINPKRVSTVIERVGYWRKANQIHKWFVDHVQNGVDNCEEYYVSREQLQLLLDTCKIVLIDKEEAKTLLPRQEGFFFGSYEYDEYYWSDIQDTIEQLEKVLTEYPQEWSFKYMSSW